MYWYIANINLTDSQFVCVSQFKHDIYISDIIISTPLHRSLDIILNVSYSFSLYTVSFSVNNFIYSSSSGLEKYTYELFDVNIKVCVVLYNRINIYFISK